MVFGLQKLQNDVFCLTEERDYFQGKFLEQVSELTALKEELRLAKKEITKLRQQLMNTSMSEVPQVCVATPKKANDDSKENDDDDDDDLGSESEDQEHGMRTPRRSTRAANDDDDSEDDDDDEDKEAKDIRQSAEKLLQWASYRSSIVSSSNTPTTRTVATDHSSVSSSSIQEFDVPRTIRSASLEEQQQQQVNDEDEQQADDEDDLRDSARRLVMETAA